MKKFPGPSTKILPGRIPPVADIENDMPSRNSPIAETIMNLKL